MFYQKLLRRKNQIESQLIVLKKEIEGLPSGELHLRRNGDYTKWFNHCDGRIEYIPKKQRGLAEQLAIRKYKTVADFRVRSKSESLIVSALYLNHIPFRYECALHLGEIVVYPDFTILHPITKKIYYYEHFGMMDNSEYAHSAYRKLELYSEHGIIPTINLLTTFETKNHPLDYGVIDKLIADYFL